MAADSPATLQYQIDCLRDSLCQAETEDSWNKIARAIENLSEICTENSEDYHSIVTSAVRSLSRPLTSAIISERTRLSGTAVDFVGAIATSLERNFESLVPVFIPALLTLCSRTNKVFGARAKACLAVIIEMTQLASLLPYFVQAGKDKSALLRHAAAEAGLACLNSCNPQDLEKEARIRDIESMVRLTAKDANADVRKVGKKIFQAYQALMPDRIATFAAPLSPTMRKYLELPAAPQALAKKDSRPNLRTLVKSKSHAHLSSSASSVRSTSPTLSSSVGVGQRPMPERPMSSMSRAPPAPSHSYSKLRNEMGPPALPHTRSQPAPPARRPQSTLSRSTSAMERPRSMVVPSVAALRTVAPSSSSELGVAVPRARVTGAIRVRPESIHGMPSAAASTVMARRVPAPEPSPTEKEKEKDAGRLFVPKRPMSAVDPAMASTSTTRSMDNGHRNKPPPPPILGKGKEKETSKPLPKITAKLTTTARAVSVTARDRVPSSSKPSVPRQASVTIQSGSRFAPSRSASSTHSKPSSSPAEDEGAPAAPFPATEAEDTQPAPTARPTHKVTASLTISKERHAPRTGGLSQPTQAQLARQKPPVERKVTAPVPNKPGWGRTGAAPPPRQRTVSTTAISKAAETAAKPGPRQRVVSMRPGAPVAKAPGLVKKSSVSSLRVDAAKVPLPPSPRPAEKKKRASPSPAPVEEEIEDVGEPAPVEVAQEQEHLSQVLEEEDVFEEKRVQEKAIAEDPAENTEAPEPTPVAPETVALPEETADEVQAIAAEEAPQDAADEATQDVTPRKAAPATALVSPPTAIDPAGIAFQTTAATPPAGIVPTHTGPVLDYNPITPARSGLHPGEGLDKTPISQLLMSIERGFHWTPEPPSPMSPAEAYRDMPVMSGVFGQPIPIHLKKEPEARYDA
ncbi:clasp N terminal-domain-containing protein [Schizophyllum fasciatum]